MCSTTRQDLKDVWLRRVEHTKHMHAHTYTSGTIIFYIYSALPLLATPIKLLLPWNSNSFLYAEQKHAMKCNATIFQWLCVTKPTLPQVTQYPCVTHPTQQKWVGWEMSESRSTLTSHSHGRCTDHNTSPQPPPRRQQSRHRLFDLIKSHCRWGGEVGQTFTLDIVTTNQGLRPRQLTVQVETMVVCVQQPPEPNCHKLGIVLVRGSKEQHSILDSVP